MHSEVGRFLLISRRTCHGPLRALVTGAGGFLGTHLVGALQRGGYEPVAFEGDVREPAAWAAHEPADVLLHLAAISNVPASTRDPERAWQVNADGTLRALEWARAGGARRVVLVSSAHVYGRARYSPIDEKHPLAPVSPYGASKLAADALGRAYHQTYGLEVVVVRPFNIYGPGQAAGFVVPDIMLPLASGKVPVLGDPRPVRDFTYVDDAADMLLKSANVPGIGGLALNLGSGNGHAISEVASVAAEVSGTGLAPVFDPAKVRGGEADELVVDNGLAMSALSWKPSVPLRDGLARTWAALVAAR
jgi:nucleoside-diphosphate-sugar epimerase